VYQNLSKAPQPEVGYALLPFGVRGGHVNIKHLHPTKIKRDMIDQLSSAIYDGFS
jgi:hypothetical protein